MTIILLCISVATFLHTVVASSLIFEGLVPDVKDLLGSAHWYFSGVLIAIAIDAAMLISSRRIEKNPSPFMFIAFVSTALASFYCQLFYALRDTPLFTYGSGVSSYWQQTLQPLIDARVLVLPAVLPIFAVVLTLANLAHARHTAKQEALGLVFNNPNVVQDQTDKQVYFHCKQCGFNSKPYKSMTVLRKRADKHINEHIMTESLVGNVEQLVKSNIEYEKVL